MGAVNGVVRVSGTRDSDGLGRTQPPPDTAAKTLDTPLDVFSARP